jgi:hypothetical protein
MRGSYTDCAAPSSVKLPDETPLPSKPERATFSRKVVTAPKEWIDEEQDRSFDMSPISDGNTQEGMSSAVDPWEKGESMTYMENSGQYEVF